MWGPLPCTTVQALGGWPKQLGSGGNALYVACAKSRPFGTGVKPLVVLARAMFAFDPGSRIAGTSTSADTTLMARPERMTTRRRWSRERVSRTGRSRSWKLSDAKLVATKAVIATVEIVLSWNCDAMTSTTGQCQRYVP